MTLAEMITMVRDFARNAQDSTMYPDARITRAIDVAADEWQRVTKAPRTLGTLTLTAGSSALPNFPATWLPERHLQATLVSPTGEVINPDVAVVSDTQLRRQQFEYGSNTSTGDVQSIAYLTNSTASTGTAFPVPNAANLIYLWYWVPFNSTTPNLPDDHLRAICTWGAPVILQQAEPENFARCERMWAKFQQVARDVRARDAGGRTGALSFKDGTTKLPRDYYPVG
jgi:hypothetical protein